MKTPTSNYRLFLGLTLLTAPLCAHAQSSNAPGFLADYQYQVSNLSSFSEAQALMDTENPYTSDKSICSSRAELWSYIMNRDKKVQVGKVFIHFTALGEANENKEWAYHVAPYVLVNGEEVVMDRAFVEFNQKPTPLANWTQHFGKSQNCVVLDPVNNKNHLRLEQNDLPKDDLTPLTYKKGP
ncbi:MAG: hypothetical protein H7333_05815, partial [Bdellovibrionales bacterium]|nr:hypothetical protein [Oligoflexia bacterium]